MLKRRDCKCYLYLITCTRIMAQTNRCYATAFMSTLLPKSKKSINKLKSFVTFFNASNDYFLLSLMLKFKLMALSVTHKQQDV